jgi:hypothetical protein
VHTAQVAIETYATEKNGSYAGATNPLLHAIEPSLPAAQAGPPEITIVSEAANKDPGYQITVKSESASGNTFTVENDKGTLTYKCATGGNGGCPTNGEWNKG